MHAQDQGNWEIIDLTYKNGAATLRNLESAEIIVIFQTTNATCRVLAFATNDDNEAQQGLALSVGYLT